MNFKILVKKHSEFLKCPSCNSVGTLRKSRSRSIKEKTLKRFFFIYYYRCKKCKFRFSKFGYKLANNFVGIIILYFVTIFLSAYIVLKVLQKFF